MQQDKVFKVGDIVKFKNCRDKGTKIPAGFSGGSKEFTKHGVTTFKENKGIIKGIVGNYFYIEYIGDNNKPVCLGFTIDKFELLESKQKQYYTSIPTDVQVGDKFVVCCNLNDRGQNYQGRLNSLNLVIGDIVTLDGNDGTINPYFSHKEDRNVINWGCLKPVKEEEYKVGDWALLVDKRPNIYPFNGKMDKYLGTVQQIKSKTSYDFCLENCEGWSFIQENFVKKVDSPVVTASLADIQQFKVGDEVEYISKTGISTNFEIGEKGVVVSYDSRDNTYDVKGNNNSQWVKPNQIKLINNKTDNNNGKVQSSNNSTWNQSIALHGIPASIICGTVSRGETISCSRAKISMGN